MPTDRTTNTRRLPRRLPVPQQCKKDTVVAKKSNGSKKPAEPDNTRGQTCHIEANDVGSKTSIKLLIETPDPLSLEFVVTTGNPSNSDNGVGIDIKSSLGHTISPTSDPNTLRITRTTPAKTRKDTRVRFASPMRSTGDHSQSGSSEEGEEDTQDVLQSESGIVKGLEAIALTDTNGVHDILKESSTDGANRLGTEITPGFSKKFPIYIDNINDGKESDDDDDIEISEVSSRGQSLLTIQPLKAAFDFELHSMLIVTSKRGVTFKDLPTSVRNSFGDFLATVIQLVGTSYYPWELNHRKYIEQYFCNVHEIYFYMYEDEAARSWLKHTGSREILFSLINNWICFWRGEFGSGARKFVRDELRKQNITRDKYEEYCSRLLGPTSPFMYKEFDYSRERGSGIFRSDPILQTLSKHFVSTSRAVQWNEEVAKSPPYGAIALATAAVHRAYSLLRLCTQRSTRVSTTSQMRGKRMVKTKRTTAGSDSGNLASGGATSDEGDRGDIPAFKVNIWGRHVNLYISYLQQLQIDHPLAIRKIIDGAMAMNAGARNGATNTEDQEFENLLANYDPSSDED